MPGIPGSAVTKIEKQNSDRSIVYTGDFKLQPQTLHDGAEIIKGNTLIIESTYGGRETRRRRVSLRA